MLSRSLIEVNMRSYGVCRVVATCISIAATSTASAQPPLSANDLAAVEAGAQVVRNDPVANSAWPRVTIHQFVAASPLEAVALFADYPRHADYLPGLRRVSISARVSSTVAEVDYLLAVPLFPDEAYTVRDSISRSNDGASYRVDWRMVRARSTRAIVGSARFEPHRNARTGVEGTLLTYDNLVVPGQALAGPLKGRAQKQVRATVTALVAEIERTRREQPELLASQVQALRSAFERTP